MNYYKLIRVSLQMFMIITLLEGILLRDPVLSFAVGVAIIAVKITDAIIVVWSNVTGVW